MVVLACAAGLGAGRKSSAVTVDASFEIRKGAGEADATLNVGENLTLEVWMTLTSSETIPAVTAAHIFASLDAAAENNIISYNTGSWTQAPAFDMALINGTPNTPVVGDIGAVVFSTSGVTFAHGVAGLVGTFTIRALNPGTVDYVFAHAPPQRPRNVNLAGPGEIINYSQVSPPLRITVTPRIIAGRHVFYNNSFFDSASSTCNTLVGQTCNDDTAIATDKVALAPGQTAGIANYISYNRSINGLMIDVAPGANGSPLPAGPLAASNFDFKIANSANLGSYVAAAAPLSINVTPGGGVGGSDRIVIIWADNAIPNTEWLRVVVKSNVSGGQLDLATDDIFYFGVAIGESLTPSAMRAIVSSTDEIDVRNHPHNSLPANRVPVAMNSTYQVGNAPDARYDYDKSSTVSTTDEIIARYNPTNTATALLLLNPAP